MLFFGIATDELGTGIFVGDQVQMNLTSVDGPGHVYLYATDISESCGDVQFG